jgi:hypothetical protein
MSNSDTIRTLNERQLEEVQGGRAHFRPIPEGSDMKRGARVYRSWPDESLEDDGNNGKNPDVHVVVRR